LCSVLLIQPALNEAGVISLGLLSIATYLRRNGHDAKIVVLSSEDDVKRKVREYAPIAVGISYHWFIHSNVLQIAKMIKAESPGTRVLLGGFSASHFDKQILEYDEERYIDAIIRGDGERPFLDYVSTLDPRKVENLTYRHNGRIIKKPVTYTQGDLSGFSCTTSISCALLSKRIFIELAFQEISAFIHQKRPLGILMCFLERAVHTIACTVVGAEMCIRGHQVESAPSYVR